MQLRAIQNVSSFNATTQTWVNVSVTGGSFNTVKRGGASSATTSTSGLGLSLITGGFDSDTPPGMIVFDASDLSALTWADKTKGAPHLDIGTAICTIRQQGSLDCFGRIHRCLFLLYLDCI